MGWFSGKQPSDLGFRGGAFTPGDWKPNWVSSTVPRDDAKHYVAPLIFSGDAAAAWSKLQAVVGAQARAAVITRDGTYLHAQFASASMGFVDDTQFALDAAAGVIHVKSGARLGVSDFGVNRKRVESIRAAFSR
jgi:uncharacterized protein (DUF1499 family)